MNNFSIKSNYNYVLLSKIVLVLCVLTKVLFSCFAYIDHKNNDTIKFSASFSKEINNDEWDLASRAYNLLNGRGLVKNINSNDSISYKLSSNRPLFNIGLHCIYQKIYAKFKNLNEKDIIGENNVVDRTNLYYKSYAMFINYTSLILFLISGFSFYQILKNIGIENVIILNLVTGLYLVFTSSLIYIGLIPLYENISSPISVISMSLMIRLYLNQLNINWLQLISIQLLLVIAILLRPQMLIPVLLLFSVFLFFTIKKKSNTQLQYVRKLRLFIAGFSMIFILFQSTIVLINYKFFNKIFYTNRADGYMWGHYELAKGSWDGTFEMKNSVGYNYMRKMVPDFDSLTEIEQNTAQKNIANHWILNNPYKELKLIFKKTAIFFMPLNFNSNSISFMMMIIHFFFFTFLIYMMFNYTVVLKNTPLMFIFSFIIGVLLVNIIFFVEHRVKYFADPFLLIIFGYMLHLFIDKYHNYNNFNKE